MNLEDPKTEKTKELLARLENADVNTAIDTNLYTSDRVLARITDGIYRLPSSALRELICNAYDADATKVEIQTNPPIFDEIIVQDDGNGLTIEALAYLIHNIGGSAKRTNKGTTMNVCSEKDPTRSPGGRKLIGKIGIGLFSVSQLTKTFQIITKRRGDNFRTIADVVLKTHSEEDLVEGDEFVTGDVKIWKVPAEDKEGHGTRILLRSILPKTREHLRSQEIWMRCFPKEYESMQSLDFTDEAQPSQPPKFHIGRTDRTSQNILTEALLPWDNTVNKLTPKEKMAALVDAVYDLRTEIAKPSIMKYFDNYFQMIWTLSLSVPLDYVDIHPFDLSVKKMQVFQLSNELSGQAQAIVVEEDQSIREHFSLSSPERGGNVSFSVIIDGIELLRPIKFTNLPKTAKSRLGSLMFIGHAAPDLSKVPKEIRGGDLEFEAYFLWNSVIAPKEHAGILVRINDASGTTFDESFMKYPISEIVRTSQVTAEIFVKKGLDAALNIDRESFNFSHPHYQYIAVWVHNAFRQLSNREKELSRIAREQARKTDQDCHKSFFREVVDSIPYQNENKATEVVFTDEKEQIDELRVQGTLAYNRSAIVSPQDSTVVNMSPEVEEKVKAIIQILDRMNVLEVLSYSQQQELISKIATIISR